MSTTHRSLARGSAHALALLGGPLHGEKYRADVPPAALRLTTPEGAGDTFYVLRTPSDDTTRHCAAYVLDSLDTDTALAWLDAWGTMAHALPGAWQWHALRRLYMSPVACRGCGRCSGVYSVHGAGQREDVAFHCLDCGAQRATLTACSRDTAAGRPQPQDAAEP
jgi:hypothetical protein